MAYQLTTTGHPIMEQYICPVVGLALCSTGIYGIARPLAMGKIFGLQDLTPANITFYPGLAGRNLSAGLAVFSLLYTRQYRALGTVLFCWANTGIWDLYLMLTASKEGRKVEKMGTHVFNTIGLVILGSGLIGWW